MDEGFDITKVTKGLKQAVLPAIIVGAVVIGVGGFVGGMQFQKGKGSTTNASGQQQTTDQAGGAFGGRGMGMGRGAFGTVTAVNSSSITVKNDRQGTESTLTISSDTKVTDNGSTASVSDITVGDQVMVQTDTTDTKKATQIRLNPTMPGGTQPSQSTTGT